jgi:ubiquinone/menaquinone biosynthesis C-methylase UbiE
MATDYLHGYDREEQAKLDKQAELTYDVTKKFLRIQNTTDFKLMDVGCGTGYTLHRLAQEYPRADFLGIDVGEKHLTYAKKRCKSLENCSFIKKNILEEDIEGQYDIVFLKYVIIHLNNQKKVLQIIRKLLKDNGRVSIFDNCWSGLNMFPESDYFKQYVNDARKYWIESGRDPDIGAKLGYLLHETGFINIRVEQVPSLFSKDMNFDDFQWRCERTIEGLYEDLYSLLSESKDSFIHKYDIEKLRAYKNQLLSLPGSQIAELKFQAEGTISKS